MLELLDRLVKIPTVTTREEKFLNLFLDNLEEYELYGKNILVRRRGDWFLVAHYDNIGFVLEDYLGDGKYMYSTRGLVNIKEGLVKSILDGKEIIGILRQDVLELDYYDELEELYPFVYYNNLWITKEKIVGPNLDNKVGVALIIDIVQNYDINVLLLAGEEQGTTRLGKIAREFKEGKFICIDGTSQNSPIDTKGISKISYRSIEGAGTGNRAPEDMVKKVEKYMDDAETYSEYQISDATTFYRYGMKAINISYPIRYLHSPNEVVYLDNIFELRDILIKIIEDL